jgi:hypothetical protein
MWEILYDHVINANVIQLQYRNPRATYTLFQFPDERFSDIGIDFAHLPKTKNGNDMVKVIFDRLTKLVAAIPCKSTDKTVVIAKLFITNWITNGFGIPKIITSDRHAKFPSKLWHLILEDLKIKQIKNGYLKTPTNKWASRERH